jgi:hypothetical protein
LESNPATRIKIKVDKVSNYHKPASEVDIELIKDTMKMILILRVLYYHFHTGIRPGELLKINLGIRFSC